MLCFKGNQHVCLKEILLWFLGQSFTVRPFHADLPASSMSSTLYNLLNLILRSEFCQQQSLDVIFCRQT